MRMQFPKGPIDKKVTSSIYQFIINFLYNILMKKAYCPISVECMSPFGLPENRHDAH